MNDENTFGTPTLPRKAFLLEEELAGRAVGRQSGEIHGSLRALADRQLGAFPSHLRLHPARVPTVDLYLRILQRIGKIDGVHVQGGFGYIIREIRNTARVKGQTAHKRRKIDDTSFRGGFYQFQKLIGDTNDADEIHVHAFHHVLQLHLSSLLLVEEAKASVVDEDVEVGVLGVDGLVRLFHRLVARHVELHGLHVGDAFGLQLLHGRLALSGVTAADDDGVAQLAHLTGGLQTNTTVGASDENGFHYFVD
ncbi:hypothetical protein, conserved [Angomonas deanei]|uniref:Uncharacterized protein n=1 Tax=Angomonas deanei TaxID=59799 RepID=A0A7G2C3C5_9TRYP|nr:hypothetical protein, conserved [Angomonas deanei]